MKRISILLLTVVLIYIQSCENQMVFHQGKCLEVSVVTELCNQVVLQLESTNSDQLELGTFTYEGELYENVFKTFFHCDQMADVPLDGSVFSIELLEEETWRSLYNSTDCVVCEPLLAGELDFSYVRILENCAGDTF